MTLKELVDNALRNERRTFDWLCNELEMTPQGLRGTLTNETLKFKDLKKLLTVLNLSLSDLGETVSTVQNVKGNYNTTAVNSNFSENQAAYKVELDHKSEKIEILEKQLIDKDEIIKLLREKLK